MIVAVSAVSFMKQKQDSSIKIIYVNTFTDLKGNDISDQLAHYFGKENHYFINNSNYKAYNENNKLLYLYNSGTNTYYSVIGQDNTAQKVNAQTGDSKSHIKVRRLPQKEMIAGYECSAVELKTGNNSTIYYYNSAVSIDKTNYAKHNYGDWNKCLDATNGALPLKMVYTDKNENVIWTAVAKQISKVQLTQSDYELPAGIKVKN